MLIYKNWFLGVYRVWLREFKLVFSDVGVLIFFLMLPTLYPLVYTLIYNPEVVRDVPVVVVDDSRTSRSREFVRMADATEAIHIIGYAVSLNDARRCQNEKTCYGILVIPEDYDYRIGRGEQAAVVFYSEMSLLIRYRGFLSAMTDLAIATGTDIRRDVMGAQDVNAVESESFILGDTTQGFASFIIPGILIIILQQSLVLGIAMLGGGASERRKRNRGMDPLAVETSVSATLFGKALCYFVLYIPLTIYALYFIPFIFNLPHVGNPLDYLIFVVPMLLSSIFMGMVIQCFISERETSMLVVVVTSVIFLFLSGLTWPRYAMSDFWIWIGNCVPAVWGVEGFIRINSNGATLQQTMHQYIMLWVLTAVYFVAAYLIKRLNTVNLITK